MKLKKKYDSQDDIPEWAVGLYVEDEGVWTLREEFEGLEGQSGSKTAEKLDEFRDTNRRLLQENQEIKSKFGNLEKQLEKLGQMEEQLKQYEGISPDHVEHLRKLAAKEQDHKVKSLLESGDIDAALEARYGRQHKEMKAEMDNLRQQVQEESKRRQQKEAQLASVQAKNNFKSLISARGVRLRRGAEDALEMFIDNDWTTDENGQLKLKRKDLLGDDGEMRPQEYLEKELLERKSFLFEPAKGGGSGGNDEDTDRTPGGKVIARDAVSFGMNLEEIAKGDVNLRDREV